MIIIFKSSRISQFAATKGGASFTYSWAVKSSGAQVRVVAPSAGSQDKPEEEQHFPEQNYKVLLREGNTANNKCTFLIQTYCVSALTFLKFTVMYLFIYLFFQNGYFNIYSIWCCLYVFQVLFFSIFSILCYFYIFYLI